jgi:magnesium-transporting ATPase (P-type)
LSGSTYFYALAVLILLFLFPYLIIRDLKKGRRLSTVFTSHVMTLILLFVALGEVLKVFLSESSMEYYNQIFFLGIIVLIVLPLILLFFYTLKNDSMKWKDPNEYKYQWLFKFRYLLMAAVGALFLGAMFRFYQIFMVLF